jgi:regulatory protein
MWKTKQKTKEPENLKKAYDYAVFLLSLQLRTEGEIVSKMKNRGYTETIIESIIGQLKENRYLDDQRYAEVYLDNLKKYKTFGYYGIKKKLMEKRLTSEITESVLGEALSEEEEIKIAKKVLKRVGVSLKPIPTSNEKSKLAQKLKSKGFRGSIIAKLLF